MHIKAQHFSLNLFMSQRSLFVDLLPMMILFTYHFPFSKTVKIMIYKY